MEIYQKPVIVKDVEADFEYVADVKPNFFTRICDAFHKGMSILEEIVIFLVQFLGVILMCVALVIGIKYIYKIVKK